MVPLLDLTRQFQAHADEFNAAALQVLSDGAYILGPYVDRFEAEAAQALGTRHAIGVANGTDALQICLQAMGVGAGDEVITTPFSFFSTAEVVSRAGATPVFADIEPDTFNLDPVKLEEKITPRTRAIIPVHLFGHPAAPQILDIARRRGLQVLEDTAQAWGAHVEINGETRRCGALGATGDMAAFSFYPTKNLGAAGDAGMVATNDDALAETARALRVHGSRRRYYHDEIGFNSRLDAMQAALLSIKLRHVDAWNDARRAHAAQYNALLANTGFVLPCEQAGTRHVYHQYTIRVRGGRRDEVAAKLREAGIGCAIFYPVPLHRQAVYESLGYSDGDLPVSEAACREVLSLPMFPELREDEIEQVASALRECGI
jgi:dTDP-4-amino-4,6-dideoxygalactose transaminase